MLLPKIYLTILALLYLVLAIWCIALPGKTSQAVGFTLTPGNGQSEYLVIYGGLQLALALIFLLPYLQPNTTPTILLIAIIIHASIVIFRAISLLRFEPIQNTTLVLAAVEWVILIPAIILYFTLKQSN